MKLDNTSSAPTYQKVAAAIRQSIETGELRPGDQLPAGPKLASELGVALMTVRRAIDSLRDEGLLRSSHGVGVFVATNEVNENAVDALRRELDELRGRVERLERESGTRRAE
jgi:DNA-binding GntR family transcriptional regulator